MYINIRLERKLTCLVLVAITCLTFAFVGCRDEVILPPGTLAVSAEGPEGSEIFLVDIQTQLQTKITNRPGRHSHPVFSPDGKKILYITESRGQISLYQYSVADKTTSQLPVSPTSAATWAPDGKNIIFYCDKKICVANTRGEITSQWSPEDYLKIIETSGPPSRSAESGDLAFLAENSKQEVDIYVVDENWENLRRVLYNRTSKYMPPYQDVDQETLEKRLDARRITGDEKFAVWAPKNNRLLMMSDYDHYKKISLDLISKAWKNDEVNFTDVYVVDLTYAHLFSTYEGKKKLREKKDWPQILTKITKDPIVEGPPSWSPDEQWAANTFVDQTGKTLIKLTLLADPNSHHEITILDREIIDGPIDWSN